MKKFLTYSTVALAPAAAAFLAVSEVYDNKVEGLSSRYDETQQSIIETADNNSALEDVISSPYAPLAHVYALTPSFTATAHEYCSAQDAEYDEKLTDNVGPLLSHFGRRLAEEDTPVDAYLETLHGLQEDGITVLIHEPDILDNEVSGPEIFFGHLDNSFQFFRDEKVLVVNADFPSAANATNLRYFAERLRNQDWMPDGEVVSVGSMLAMPPDQSIGLTILEGDKGGVAELMHDNGETSYDFPLLAAPCPQPGRD